MLITNYVNNLLGIMEMLTKPLSAWGQSFLRVQLLVIIVLNMPSLRQEFNVAGGVGLSIEQAKA
jgi:hypothetical protein